MAGGAQQEVGVGAEDGPDQLDEGHGEDSGALPGAHLEAGADIDDGDGGGADDVADDEDQDHDGDEEAWLFTSDDSDKDSLAMEEVEEEEKTMDDVMIELVTLFTRHHVSKEAIKDFMQIWRGYARVLAEAAQTGSITSYKTMWRRAAAMVPQIRLDTCHRNKVTKENVLESNLTAYPRGKYQRGRNYSELWTMTRVPLEQVLDFHRSLHGDPLPDRLVVQLQEDDFPEAKTQKGKSLLMVTMTVQGCINVYPIRVLRMMEDIPRKEKLAIVWKELAEECSKGNACLLGRPLSYKEERSHFVFH